MNVTAAALADLGTLLRDAARAEVMPRFRRLPAGAVRQKTGPLDLVTDADEAAEAMIAAGLARLFPGCTVIGEEAASRDPARLAALRHADLAVVVDPIDGTYNYAAGLPLFGCMAAVIRRGEIVASVIHDPVCDDAAYALRGEGAWLEDAAGARRDLRVAAAAPLAAMGGIASWRFLDEPLRGRVMRGLAAVAANWDYRCAAHQYRLLAAGHVHFMLFGRTLPWDHAPGWLLHREAGGHAARFDGSPYDPAETAGGLLCAPDEAGWHALRHTLLGDQT